MTDDRDITVLVGANDATCGTDDVRQGLQYVRRRIVVSVAAPDRDDRDPRMRCPQESDVLCSPMMRDDEDVGVQ